jgi:large subunit ribosomal protein L9
MTKKVRKEVQIVLTQTIPNLGKAGSLVVVRSGYARNYLIPLEKGELATPIAIKTLEVKQKEIQVKEQAQIENCLKNKAILEQVGQFTIQKRVGEDNKIFGKITLKQVREVLENKTGIDLNDATVELPEIKELGSFSVTVNLHPTIQATIKVDILPQ